MNPNLIDVPSENSYRPINHGPIGLLFAHHHGVDTVMTAARAWALDFSPSKLMVMPDVEA